MAQRRQVQIYNNIAVFEKQVYSAGTATEKLSIRNGARLVFTMYVAAIDPATTVNLKIGTAFSESMPVCNAVNLSTTIVGFKKAVLSDFHGFIDVELEVIGGTADVIVGMTVFDNAMTTRIENAQIDVNLTQDDEVTVFQGTNPWIVQGNLSVTPAVINPCPTPEYLKDSTNIIEMNVNGGGTPVVYKALVPAGKIWIVDSLDMLLVDPGDMFPDRFGAIKNGLTNGLLFEAVIKGAAIKTIFNMKDNIDLAMIFSEASSGSSMSDKDGFMDTRDKFSSKMKFTTPLRLIAGDFIQMTVRDKLSKLQFFRVLVNKHEEI